MKKFLCILVGITIFFLLLSFNFALSKISGDGMFPNYPSGKTVLFKKYFLFGPDPFRGDVVLYRPANSDVDRIGRVVALPGESIRVENGNIYLDNGKQYRMKEEYLSQGTVTRAVEEEAWFRLEPNYYLILSDSRNNPIDIQGSLINRYRIKGVLF